MHRPTIEYLIIKFIRDIWPIPKALDTLIKAHVIEFVTIESMAIRFYSVGTRATTWITSHEIQYNVDKIKMNNRIYNEFSYRSLWYKSHATQWFSIVRSFLGLTLALGQSISTLNVGPTMQGRQCWVLGFASPRLPQFRSHVEVEGFKGSWGLH